MSEWSAPAAAVWGKSCRDDPTRWLPLVQHLTDSAAVAGYLWDYWLPTHVKVRIEAALPVEARDGRALVCWLAGVHDVGKSSGSFTCQVPHLAEWMRAFGADVPVIRTAEHRMASHAAVGQIALEEWLQERYGAKVRQSKAFGSVIGAHHGMPQRSAVLSEVRRRRDLTGTGIWAEVRTEILDRMRDLTGVGDLLPHWCRSGIDVPAQMLVTGVVIVADWIASDESRFPYLDRPVPSDERAARAWADLALPPAWAAEEAVGGPDALFTGRFPALGSSARPLQTACCEIAGDVDEPCLLILEAPMGQGKTEAALMAAEVLAARFGLGGVFFGLPSMATSNAVFSRVLDWIEHLPGEGATSTFLAHSKAELDDEYAGLVHDAYVREVYDEAESTDPGTVIAIVDSWLQGRKKGVLANFVVGTIDQALFAALSTKHLMLRHLALVGKVVVIDEVHAADDYMRVYLTRVLEWLGAYGVPVVLLSATLPSVQRHELVAAYRRGIPTEREESDALGYPLITVATATEVRHHTIAGSDVGTTVRVRPIGDEPAELGDLLESLLIDGGCAAVIRDTVNRAQQTYLGLVERFGADQVVLVHSRFLAPDRAEREADLRHRLGPRGEARPERLIVVGTQVLEQSLDVDFDVMVSDIAPIDLLLQRSGRLHRHRRARPTGLEVPRLYLTGIVGWDDAGPAFDRGCVAVYREARLLRACLALGLEGPTEVGIDVPGDIRRLVEAGYDVDAKAPPAWQERLVAADAKLADELRSARGRAQTYCIDEVPADGEELLDAYPSLTVESNEERQGGAGVRDGDDGLEVLVVRRQDGEIRTMPGVIREEGAQIPGIGCPDPQVAKAIATSSVRLPASMTGPWAIDRVIAELETSGFPNWQESGWLRGQLVLVLDESLTATIAEFRLGYDHDLGLTVTEEEAQ